MKNKSFLLLGVLLILAVIFVYWFGSPRGPSLDKVAYLKAPRITTLPSQKVLLVTAKGDPNAAGMQAFGLLMKTYFKLKGVPKGGPNFKPPRARWPVGADVPVDQWVGLYAMPVPETVTALPTVKSPSGFSVELTTWEYGEVAEILHVGSYANEKPTIESLHAFIAQQGYEISGLHEEEYLKGPGMFFKGNPETYLTIIRYQIARKK
jgi:hypothetical protein